MHIYPASAIHTPSCAIAQRICFADLYSKKETRANVTIPSETRQATLPSRTNDVATLLRGRRSVRKYQARPVPRAYIEQILEAARWAPSPHGRQPWRFVVLTRPELKAHLAEQMGQTWQHNLEMDGQDEAIVNIRLEKSRQR